MELDEFKLASEHLSAFTDILSQLQDSAMLLSLLMVYVVLFSMRRLEEKPVVKAAGQHIMLETNLKRKRMQTIEARTKEKAGGILDAYNKKITVQSRGKTLILDVKLKGESIPTVSASAISSVMKKHLSAYLAFEREVSDCDESNLSLLIKERSMLLQQYSDCFSHSLPSQLPPERPEDHAIDLVPGSSPPNRPPYRVSAAQQKEIMSQVEELLEKGLIQPSSSPFCSPMLLVQKKDGSWCMCIDYRALNKNTIKNRFPIPTIDDILDKLEGAAMFSRIELKSGYHQIRIKSEDVHKTAFRTTFGLYEFLVMPFSLTNAPTTFNRMMDRIFRPHQQFVGTFFDDMIVYSKNEEKHRHHLAIVFKELRSHRLLINAKKSEFFLKKIHFLGHIISKDGVRMDSAKSHRMECKGN
ncbi:hypothetical protein L7F22_046345 [Adiantum nelumboides]|nr:hypothetical protein [Adiantum nelumboides]